MLLTTTSDIAVLAPKFVGEIAILTVAAVFVGFVVYKLLPASASPKLFATLVPFLGLGVLAYMGSFAAATALVLFAGIAIIALALGAS